MQKQTNLQEIQDELSSLLAVQSQHSNLEEKASEAATNAKWFTEKQEPKDQLNVVCRSLDDAVSRVHELEER